MTFIHKIKSKAGVSYLVLLLGFLFSVVININFVSDRAVSSLSTLQENHTKLQAQSSFNNIQQFIDSRVKLLWELSDSPVVTSSVMGVDYAAANLSDLLNEKKVLGYKESIYLTDFNGALIYSNNNLDWSTPQWFSRITEGEIPLIVTVVEINNLHYFRVAAPVKYNDLVEGGIMFELISHSIESLIDGITVSGDYAITLTTKYGDSFQKGSLNGFELVDESVVAENDLVLSFYVSTALREQEKKQYVWQIGTTLVFTTLGAFILLAFLIRSLLINPLQKLAHSEEKIKQSEERYQLAILGSNDGIWDWDLNSNTIYLSPKLRSMLGDESMPSKIQGGFETFLNQYVHPDDIEKFKEAVIGHFKENIPFDFECRLCIAADKYRYFRVRGVAQKNERNRAVRMAGSVTDVTKAREQSLALEHALSDAKAANIAKSDFLANMSHEIRTPLNGVLGTLQLLKRENLSDYAKELVETGTTSSKALLCIINDILDLSKIESNNISLESIPINLVELFQRVVSELSVLSEEKGVGLSLNVEESFHAYWFGDPIRIRQILMNLMSNGIKFTSQGEVTISLFENNDGVVFSVQDTGIGISDEQIKKLFIRFEQADSTTTRNFGGTGLGLAISKSLANLMEGDISVVSQENVGSTFTVDLPLTKSNATQEKKNKEAEVQISAPNASSLDILLAEDNKINQKIFIAVMSPTKANIRIANDGEEALNEIKACVPDLVFMDIQMPNMDGVEACETIRKRLPDLPVFALTANVMSEDVEHYKNVGFDECLAKPINVPDVYKLLQRYL